MEFIKNYKYETIQKKFILLYILNISDVLFTLALIETGFFKEANVVMVNIVENTILSLVLKVVVVGALIFIIYKRMAEATEKQLRISNLMINGVIVIYGIINLMHITYVVIYINILNIWNMLDIIINEHC